MSILVYILRAFIIYIVTWFGLRILGKKTISQMTSYDLAGVLIMTTVASEPLVYKIPAKAAVGVVAISLITLYIGKLSLKNRFYNVDTKPSVIINKGYLDKDELKKAYMNLPYFLSRLRIKGYTRVSDIEYALVEPDGEISVIPKSQSRPVTPSDLKINTNYEGLTLPLIVDGFIQHQNLKNVRIDEKWLTEEIKLYGAKNEKDVFFAELDGSGQLFVNLYTLPNENIGKVRETL